MAPRPHESLAAACCVRPLQCPSPPSRRSMGGDSASEAATWSALPASQQVGHGSSRACSGSGALPAWLGAPHVRRARLRLRCCCCCCCCAVGCFGMRAPCDASPACASADRPSSCAELLQVQLKSPVGVWHRLANGATSRAHASAACRCRRRRRRIWRRPRRVSSRARPRGKHVADPKGHHSEASRSLA